MFRKISIALVAAAALGIAALAPTSASAWGFHGGWHNSYNSYCCSYNSYNSYCCSYNSYDSYDSYGHRGFGHGRR
jgi:hypothetical protein